VALGALPVRSPATVAISPASGHIRDLADAEGRPLVTPIRVTHE